MTPVTQEKERPMPNSGLSNQQRLATRKMTFAGPVAGWVKAEAKAMNLRFGVSGVALKKLRGIRET